MTDGVLLPRVVTIVATLITIGACSGIGAPPSPTAPHASLVVPTPSASRVLETSSPATQPREPVLTAAPRPSVSPEAGPPDTAQFLECEDQDSNWRIGIDNAHLLVPGGATPDEALESGLAGGLQLPQTGYERLRDTATDVVFAYRARGQVKVALHISREPPELDPGPYEWHVRSVYACDLREFGADVGLSPEFGTWRNVATNQVLTDFAGWEHCNMESARILPLTSADWYVRDPEDVFAGELMGRYRASTVLPDDAVDSGFRRGDEELWLDPTGRAVFVVGPETTERWPRHVDDGGPGCA